MTTSTLGNPNRPKNLLYDIIIPVFLAVVLGPGVAQLYNREFKKGFVLIAASVGVLLAFSVWLSRAAMGYLPVDISAVDRNLLRNIIQTHIVADHPGTFYTYELILAGLWVYGIVDAYIGGMRRRTTKAVPPRSSES